MVNHIKHLLTYAQNAENEIDSLRNQLKFCDLKRGQLKGKLSLANELIEAYEHKLEVR